MIKFNKYDDIYAGFSNFFPCKVYYEGIEYSSSEAAWQAQKSLDPDTRARFGSYTASGAKKMGRRVQLRPDWEEIKYDLMVKVCYAKFSQNGELGALLLSTGDQEIIENTTAWHDNLWGDCQCVKCQHKPGKNLLGKALMEVRSMLRNNAPSEKNKNEEQKERMENPLLLVIDMQNVYSKGQQWECANFDTALMNIKNLLDTISRVGVSSPDTSHQKIQMAYGAIIIQKTRMLTTTHG